MPDNAAHKGKSSPDESPAVAAGRRLSAAREAAGLTVADVTARINLGESIIVALESGDFEAVGAPVFVRGHLKSYARLLKLPESEIASACAEPPAGSGVLLTQSGSQAFRPGFSIVNAALLAGLALLMLIALIYWAVGDSSDAENDIAPADSVTGALGAGHHPDWPNTVPSPGLSGNNTARFVVSSDTFA